MTKTAELHRMVMDKHVCPYGTKSRWLLENAGYKVEDHHLTTREQTDAFKDEHGVKTTPQTFIDGERIGGYEELRKYLGKSVKDADATSYRPVLAVFAVAAALAGMLAMLKLQDVEQFSTMFVGYDQLGRRFVPYAYAYPYLEATAAVLMVGRILPWLSIPIALFIGTVGAVSVFYAVYVQKRDIKCACVGGGSNVPLGFVSLTENLAMIAMGIWMLLGPAL